MKLSRHRLSRCSRSIEVTAHNYVSEAVTTRGHVQPSRRNTATHERNDPMTCLRIGHKSHWSHNTGYRAKRNGTSGSSHNSPLRYVRFHYLIPEPEWYQLNNSQRVVHWLRHQERWHDLIDAIRECQGVFGDRQSKLVHLCWVEEDEPRCKWFRHPVLIGYRWSLASLLPRAGLGRVGSRFSATPSRIPLRRQTRRHRKYPIGTCTVGALFLNTQRQPVDDM